MPWRCHDLGCEKGQEKREKDLLTTSSVPGARFVDPVVLSRIGNLELVARHVVDGFINGMHRSPYYGASVDFAEHRGYVAGDDIRRVDWRLYARTDRFYIKEYEAIPTRTSRCCSMCRSRWGLAVAALANSNTPRCSPVA
jgi:hypothetical protein